MHGSPNLLQYSVDPLDLQLHSVDGNSTNRIRGSSLVCTTREQVWMVLENGDGSVETGMAMGYGRTEYYNHC